MAHYEIRVVGGFPCEALVDVDQVTATPQPVQTVLSGMLTQSALNNLLARLDLLGAHVLGVRLLRSPALPTAVGVHQPLKGEASTPADEQADTHNMDASGQL
jgi:hypothetical protein